MRDPVISIRDFSLSYDGKHKVLEGINADILPSERLLVLGPSGCGKSSLMLCFNGIIPNLIDGRLGGNLLLRGKDICSMQVNELTREVGIVFQDPESQFSMLKVLDEVAFGLENLAKPRDEILAGSTDALKNVGLIGHADELLSRLSGGMKQRVAIASILAMDQNILVFDEPTSNLDPEGTRQVAGIIRGMPRSKTLIVIEHKLDQFIDIFDKILLLSGKGSMIAYGPTREILKKYLKQFKDMGIWIPQIPRFFLRLKEDNIGTDSLPLNLDQARESIKRSKEARIIEALDSQVQKRIKDGSRPKNAPAVKVKDLSFSFNAGEPVLEDITFTVGKGDFVGLVGPNGSGKTTLAKLMIGLYGLKPPSEIDFFLPDGKIIRERDKISKKCGYVFQNPEHQFIEENVFDELAYGLKIAKYGQDAIKSKTWDMLGLLGLKGLSASSPFNLSQGQKRKLSVASILIMDHDLLILDEPTFGLDFAATTMLMELLSDYNRKGKTIIIITHDMNIIFKYTSRVLVLYKGRLAFDRPTSQLIDHTQLISKASLEVPPLIKLFKEVGEHAVF